MDGIITRAHFLKRFFDFSDWDSQKDILLIEDGTLTENRPLTIYRSQTQTIIKYHPKLNGFKTMDFSVEDSNQTIIDAFLGTGGLWKEHQTDLMFAPSPIPLPPIDGLIIDTLKLERKMDLGKLKAACQPGEVALSQVGLEDDSTIGIYHGHDLLAAGSLWYLGDDLADLHLLTHPRFRSIGLGKVLVGLLVNRAFHVERIPMVRCNLQNQAAYRVALSIGFIEALSIFEIELSI
jgi:GNAT superfamily N-acetyltransferase